MIKRIVILGGHIQALGLARQAHRLGLETILCSTESFAIARFSHCVKRTIKISSYSSLIETIKAYEDDATLLFPTGDDAVAFMDKNRAYLASHFVLGIPNHNAVEVFSDKRNTASFASSHNIPHPNCFLPNTLKELSDKAPTFTYPVVLKPAVMYSFHRQFKKKAFLCTNPQDLLSKADQISRSYPVDQLLVQEFLSGGPRLLYSYGVFAVEGVPKAWIVANRIRQNPMDFGNSTTFAVTCDVPEIAAIAQRILETTHYTGLAEIEFMFNENRQRYEMLEVNTRAWKWHTLSEMRGFGFLSEMVRHLNGQPSMFTDGNVTVAWTESLTDVAVATKEMVHGRMRVKDFLSTYRTKKRHAVFSWSDPLPGLMYFILSPILYFTRH